RERQEAVRDRAAERAFADRPLHVDMDPLAVAGAVGEFVNALLVQRDPRRWAECRANVFAEPGKGNLVNHRSSPVCWGSGRLRNYSIARAASSGRVSRKR